MLKTKDAITSVIENNKELLDLAAPRFAPRLKSKRRL